MIMSFKDFIQKYNDGSIADDAAWRAYDIEAMSGEQQAAEGLRALGMYSQGATFADVGRAYSTGMNWIRAKHLLALWWTWAQIASGARRTRLIPREGQTHVAPMARSGPWGAKTRAGLPSRLLDA